MVVRHLISFDNPLVPKLFSDVVIENLQISEENVADTRKKQENGINKFTIFWNKTAEFYPKYTPFETVLDLKSNNESE